MRARETAERGATAITVAISLLVLMGFAALAMDGGIGFDDRRGTQNASDNAALAAAWEACNPRTTPADPEGAALAVAAQNGYDDTAPETSVTVTALSASEYEVVIQTSNDATFAQVGVGTDSVSVTSRAIAHCHEQDFLDGYAIFAGAEHCSTGGSVELDLSGSTKTINGGIFSNGDMKISGSDTTVNGPIEYRGNFNDGSLGLPAEQYFGSPKAYPVSLDIADWRPTGVRSGDSNYFAAPPSKTINNKWMVDEGYATGGPSSIEISQSGIFYTDANIDLNAVTAATGVTVTFVAEGSIDVNGSDTSITGYAPVDVGGSAKLALFSNAGSPPACNITAVKLSGSNFHWEGLIFAPRGDAQLSFSGISSLSGSIMAHSVKVSASSFVLSWVDDPNADPRFTVELNE